MDPVIIDCITNASFRVVTVLPSNSPISLVIQMSTTKLKLSAV